MSIKIPLFSSMNLRIRKKVYDLLFNAHLKK